MIFPKALAPPGPGRADTHRMLFAATALSVSAVDQTGKAWAVRSWRGVPGQGPLRAELVRNAGAAFGLGQQWTVVISLITVAALAVLVWAGLRARGRGRVLVLALMAGGAAGNGADRLLRAPGALHGAVVDWIKVPGYGPVFNLADVALRAGALLAVLLLLRGHRHGTTTALPVPAPPAARR
ncbi:signal peptidase II [Streptomyces sp. H10-C2]|uniref:signal peptidase II n=1 Tax=unclassified Streptomyces TaxID=2593676 RepID=UPI0024B9B4B2|nr:MULTISPECIES: signal peptidase II [unclassified Streptomyces]MDJ0346601.1 signal peptidase II [Streptomyces sp. PH10-H1]MDJ0375026.1 signal peptidase II [Streptomyces sp. H10-C2]